MFCFVLLAAASGVDRDRTDLFTQIPFDAFFFLSMRMDAAARCLQTWSSRLVTFQSFHSLIGHMASGAKNLPQLDSG